MNLEQQIIISRLNNGPKKRANGKPMSYRDEVLEAKENVIEGEVVSTDG